MEKADREILRKNRVAFTQNLEVCGDLIEHLEQDGIFTATMKEGIMAKPTRHEQASKLMDDISRRGPKAFDKFYDALCNSFQGDLADLLKPERAVVRQKREEEELMSRKLAKMRITEEGSVLTAPSDQGGLQYDRRQATEQYDEVDELPKVFPDPQYGLGEVSVKKMFCQQVASDKSNEDIVYRNVEKGRVIILDNEIFTSEKLKRRLGTRTDAKNLEALFKKELGYEVNTYTNKTAEEMKAIIENERSLEHKDCFILIVLSHGRKNIVYGTDGGTLEIDKDITNQFNGQNCPSLINKPKLFFIQACEGVEHDHGVAHSDSSTSLGENECDAESVQQVVPTHADVFVANATVPGLVSWRNTDTGTWFIQAIVRVICDRSYREELHSLFLLVNNLVSRGETKTGKKQVSRVSSSTLRKKFYFQ